MKKSLIFSLLFPSLLYAQPTTTLSYGTVIECLNTTSAGVVTGATHALPSGTANIVTAQTIMDGSAVVTSIQSSLDGTNWNTIAGMSFTSNGILSSAAIASKFVRCFQTSRTGGTTTRINIVTGRSAILQGASGTLGNQLLATNGTSTAPAIAFASESNTGIYWPSAGSMNFTIGGTIAHSFSASSFRLFSDSGSITIGGTAANNPYLMREGNHTFAQRNGTNPQIFRIYNTYTDASNYSRANFDWSGANFRIGVTKAGTGTGGTIIISPDAGGSVYFSHVVGGDRWFMSASGHWLAGIDNTYDIGASGGTRPRNIYVAVNGIFGGSVQAGPNSAIAFTGKTGLTSPVNGNLLLTNTAGTDFSLLQFGGTTSAFPALKRNTSGLHVRLADDSAYGSFNAGSIIGTTLESSGNVQACSGCGVQWNGVSRIISSVDGNIRLYNNAITDFGMLQFGGTTSSFPALKRSTTVLEAKLADDSNYTSLVAANFVDNNGSLLSSNVDGQWLMRNAAGTDFGMLQFGGTTSSFPALKRSTTQIHARLADDSAYASITGANIYGTAGIQSGTAGVLMDPVLFAALGTPPNGTMKHCSDCTTQSNPCTGSGTGAIAKRLNGAWDCR